ATQPRCGSGFADDPLKPGWVASLNRPGGNATGVNFYTAELIAKRMQLLRELVPSANRVAVLVNPTNPEGYEATVRDVQGAAGGKQILTFNVSTGREIDAAFAEGARAKADALFVSPGAV